MIAETCPITVRTVTAHLDTGRAVYGGTGFGNL